MANWPSNFHKHLGPGFHLLMDNQTIVPWSQMWMVSLAQWFHSLSSLRCKQQMSHENKRKKTVIIYCLREEVRGFWLCHNQFDLTPLKRHFWGVFYCINKKVWLQCSDVTSYITVTNSTNSYCFPDHEIFCNHDNANTIGIVYGKTLMTIWIIIVVISISFFSFAVSFTIFFLEIFPHQNAET